ncbi:MAG TPA: hypothetical protein VGH28_19125 [Polyangiaceae bacterium]
MELFSPDDAGTCAAYRACRDHLTKRAARDHLERAWLLGHATMGDREADVVGRFRRDFHSVAWELYLRAVLVDAGLTLQRTSTNGPDLCVDIGGRHVFVEAVTVGPGTGANRIQHWRDAGGTSGLLYPIEGLLLRIRSALDDKLRQLRRWQHSGVLTSDTPVIIALNHGLIVDSDLHDEGGVPAFVKAVLPVGEMAIRIDPYRPGAPSEEVRSDREQVRTAHGAPVSTRLFLEPESAPLSALLVARQLVWNLRWQAERDLLLLHNLRAATALPRRTVPVRSEMWLDGQGGILHLVRRSFREEAMRARPLARKSRSADLARAKELERTKALSPRDRAILALRLGRKSP